MDDDQTHSRVAVTRTEPDPPDAGMLIWLLSSVIPHLGISVGAIDVAVEEPHRAPRKALASPSAIKPRRVSSRMTQRLCRFQSD
jgi:hypothetical protein